MVTVSSDTDKADLLNEFFTSCFIPAVQSPSYSELPHYAEGDAAVYDGHHLGQGLHASEND